jgi:hypothetical protein
MPGTSSRGTLATYSGVPNLEAKRHDPDMVPREVTMAITARASSEPTPQPGPRARQ